MRRKGAATSGGMRATSDGRAGETVDQAHWPFSGKSTVVAVGLMAVLAIVAFGVSRETTTTSHASRTELSHPAATPPKPAFTRAEEAYIGALWPIHGDVERSTVRVSLGTIFYKTNDLGKADLKARVDAALATYQQAEARISALQPPSSLARDHEEYLEAVRLFKQSTLEMLKMFDDSNDEHLVTAFPLSHEGSNKIREVGARFWQDEFPPN
jgi:hypothetical protein